MRREVKDGWKAFQARNGLFPDGVPGAATLDAAKALEPPATRTRVYSYGGAPVRVGVNRDPLTLIPAFADKVERLFYQLRSAGHDPMLWEAYRSPERAAMLNRKGTGIKQSMHCLGAAVDIVEEDSTPWDPETHGFWDDIGDFAEALGLVVLYKGKGRKRRRFDRPHVQALPVSMQPKFRRMTKAQQVAYVTKRLAG